jgi:hypothetical protein
MLHGTHMAKKRFTYLILTALSLFASNALADTGAVAARGSGGAKDKEAVEAALQAQTQAAGWKLMSKPLAQNANDLLAICFKQAGEKAWPCIEPTAKSLGFDRVALVTLDADTAKGVFSITMQIAARGVDVAMIDRTFCDRCNTEQFVRASTDLADVMLQRLSSKGNTTLEVASVPPGAVVQIDGSILGETNNTFRTFAGTHTVMVSREGYKNYVSKVVTAEGKVTEVTVTLVAGPAGSTALTTDGIIKPGDKAATPISKTKPSKPSATSGVSPPDLISKSGTVSTTNGETGGRSKLLPGLLIGAGVLGLAAGGALIWAQEEPAPLGKEQKETLFGSSTIGIGVGIAGAAALVTGIVLWARHNEPVNSGPVAMPANGGGLFGWAGSF